MPPRPFQHLLKLLLGRVQQGGLVLDGGGWEGRNAGKMAAQVIFFNTARACASVRSTLPLSALLPRIVLCKSMQHETQSSS